MPTKTLSMLTLDPHRSFKKNERTESKVEKHPSLKNYACCSCCFWRWIQGASILDKDDDVLRRLAGGGGVSWAPWQESSRSCLWPVVDSARGIGTTDFMMESSEPPIHWLSDSRCSSGISTSWPLNLQSACSEANTSTPRLASTRR